MVYNTWEAMEHSHKEHLIEELMLKYRSKVHSCAYSIVKDHGLAEDVALEAFLKRYLHIAEFRGEASIVTWLYRITTNIGIDLIRKRSYKESKIAGIFLESTKKVPSAERECLGNMDRKEVAGLIRLLPDKYQKPITLYFYEGLKINEISLKLNLNCNTVKTRIARGKVQLNQMMDYSTIA